MNKQVKPVVIGTIGAGYAAHLHGNGYEKVSGVPIRLKTVCDLNLDLANQVKERYGYELIKTLKDRSNDAFDFKEGTLYPILHKMENEGWIRSENKTVNGRMRRYYAITARGVKQLEVQQEQWSHFSSAVNQVLSFQGSGS